MLECISEGFEKIKGFPNVVGAIDGCLIEVERPKNFKGWYCHSFEGFL